MTIFFYGNNEYWWLSNFSRTPIIINGETWPTVEHYYQAQKTLFKSEKEWVKSRPTPKMAKILGRYVTLRNDWDSIKEEIMLKALYAKFTQYPRLQEKLLATVGEQLVEDSPTDIYWGYARGAGKNRLGILLVQLRRSLLKGVDEGTKKCQ